jgi:predicted RND superfamily exporter protein
VAIIGGVITSTLLTLLVIPSFYDSIEIWREKFMRLVTRLRGKPGVSAEVIGAK